MKLESLNPPTITINPDLNLRKYQEDAIKQVYSSFTDGLKSVLLYAPTGAGKTVLAAKIIADYVQAGKRVLFLVHRGKLVRQTLDKLNKFFGIDAGVIWRDYGEPDYEKPVQIAMLQTIRNRELPPDIDLVILDEAHTGSYYNIWRQIMDYYSGGIWVLSKTQFLGLSASPWRSKPDQGYCQFFQTVVKAPYPKELIEMGHLCRARQFGYKGLIDESKLRVVDGEFTEASMRSVCTPELNREILRRYLERDPSLKRQIIAFCASVEQAQNLAKQFNAIGAKAECIVADTKETTREKIFDNYQKGKVKLITSVSVVCEGFDEPRVTSVLICRPVKSKALWVQMNGRGLRAFEGKEDCWFLDFCGNLKRLGLPTDSHPIDLCPDPKPLEPIQTKTCPQCSSEIAIFEKICPHCNFIFDSAKKVSAVRRKFEEILSPEQRQHVRFMRTRAVNAYNKCKPLHNLDEIFNNAFNYYPPDDWYDGLIFGDDFATWEINVQHYWRYLIATQDLHQSSEEVKQWIQKSIKREFKSKIEYARSNFVRNYANDIVSLDKASEIADARIQDLISYKPWWAILRLERAPDKDYLDFAYKENRFKYECMYGDKPKILQVHMELLGTAIQEGIDYYSQDAQVIRKHALTISRAINNERFSFIESYIKRLNNSERQRIWNQLTNTQKLAYRHWQKNHQNISSPVVPTEIPKLLDTKTQFSSDNSHPLTNSTAPSVKTNSNQKTHHEKPILNFQQHLATQSNKKTCLPGRYKVGDIVIYIGKNSISREQYTGLLTVHSFEYGKVCILTPSGRISTWLDYHEISKI
ncbi:hypothetical protein CAL7716_079890 [Calothrix sp. PCC 7716]|nr:hypothetical protein CAL7716_079890 [Calothrix sp. PCC 7716]